MDVEDWIDVSVVETSFALGMCALVTLSELPGDYSLCVRYVRDGDPLEACSDEPGLADERVMLDLDRFARDDSGQLYITAYRGDAPAAVCDGYELEWSVSIGSCD
jgi:hypothetical protein